MTAAAFQVRGVEKSYKDLHVLRGVDFDVAWGSIFALLGSNGEARRRSSRSCGHFSRRMAALRA
jgi:ABC-type branched-subunit amino acid transport system ATPase component